MKAIIPSKENKVDSAPFPLEGREADVLCCVLAMELYGSSLAEVARQIGGTVDDVRAVCESKDYAMVRNTLLNNVRKIDQQTLSGRMIREAQDAFDRVVELSKDSGKRVDVQLWANQDILNRAMINNVAQQSDELTITFKKRG